MPKRKNNYLLWVLVPFLLVVLLSVILAYNEYQKITSVKNLNVELSGARIESITFTQTTMTFTLNIHNPNKIKTTIGDFRANIYANEVPLTSVALEQPILLLPGESTTQKFTITASHLDIGAALLRAFKEKSVNFEMKGEYTLYLPFGIKYPYAFDIQKSIS